MQEQAQGQEQMTLKLWGVEAAALNRFYQDDSSRSGEGATLKDFYRKITAACLVVPSFILGRSGELKLAQVYAERGIKFTVGVNSVSVDPEVTKSISEIQKRNAYIIAFSLFLVISTEMLVVAKGMKRLDNVLLLELLGVASTILYYGAMTNLGIIINEERRMLNIQ